MVSKCNGRVDEALRRLKKEHLVDVGIAVSESQAEAALIAKNWDLNSINQSINHLSIHIISMGKSGRVRWSCGGWLRGSAKTGL